MSAVYVNIEPEIIQWALSQTSEERLGEKLLNNITKWLDGSKKPTFNQIREFSSKTNIPLGYFFLKTPPDEQIKLLDFRTINSTQIFNPSRDLIDTIYEMENVQNWMIEYRKDVGYEKLGFLDNINVPDKIDVIVSRIRHDLNLSETWYKNCKNSREAFNYIREKLEQYGVVVMMSGIVGSNTHRTLDTNEFRAFAMVNEWAPLIFINGADSIGARLFSLFHETAHIWTGENDLFNDIQNKMTKMNGIEALCNSIAGELMVPRNEFIEEWDNCNKEVYTKIDELAKHFRCGQTVIARKALDCCKINENIYNTVAQTAINHYKDTKNDNKNVPGGDYYKTKTSYLDIGLIRALNESINMGRTTYTEAFQLTNTNVFTFNEIVKRIGGAE